MRPTSLRYRYFGDRQLTMTSNDPRSHSPEPSTTQPLWRLLYAAGERNREEEDSSRTEEDIRRTKSRDPEPGSPDVAKTVISSKGPSPTEPGGSGSLEPSRNDQGPRTSQVSEAPVSPSEGESLTSALLSVSETTSIKPTSVETRPIIPPPPPPDESSFTDIAVSISSQKIYESPTTTAIPPLTEDIADEVTSNTGQSISNGVTVGIVVSVMAAIVGIVILLRWLRRKGLLCARRPKFFSPIIEPHHSGPTRPRPNVGAFSNPFRGGDLQTWLEYHGASAHGGPTWPNGQGEEHGSTGPGGAIEMHNYTRNPHANSRSQPTGQSTALDVQHGLGQGAGPISPLTPSEVGSQHYPHHPQNQHQNRQATGPGASAPAEDRTATLPWDDGFRSDKYRAW